MVSEPWANVLTALIVTEIELVWSLASTSRTTAEGAWVSETRTVSSTAVIGSAEVLPEPLPDPLPDDPEPEPDPLPDPVPLLPEVEPDPLPVPLPEDPEPEPEPLPDPLPEPVVKVY